MVILMKKLEVMALIPARKNSKRLLEKNKKVLNGKPLIQYTIEQAKEARYITDIIVASDDEEILEIAKKEEVYIVNRPSKISGDDTSTQEVIDYVKKMYPKDYDLYIILQPTSPMRQVDWINRCVETLALAHFDSVMTVKEIAPHVYYPTGDVYVFRDKLWNNDRWCMILVDSEKTVDINTELDFKIAEMMMNDNNS